ncbi:hypothetical protein [Rhodococcoides fascians]|uniref:hypothetical protein n=1 Tax=Rhodococcoides fascians TaxID=1828 RepID=UPI0005230590|nr:hypothetical protein [Rhodococcus fascians]
MKRTIIALAAGGLLLTGCSASSDANSESGASPVATTTAVESPAPLTDVEVDDFQQRIQAAARPCTASPGDAFSNACMSAVIATVDVYREMEDRVGKDYPATLLSLKESRERMTEWVTSGCPTTKPNTDERRQCLPLMPVSGRVDDPIWEWVDENR